MERIREELTVHRTGGSGFEEDAWAQERFGADVFVELQPRFEPAADDTYSASELLGFHDREFVRNAYRAILKRAPEPEGEAHYLRGLRSGRMHKIEILGKLRYGAEGRGKGVRVRGLLVPFALSQLERVPLAGHVLAWLLALARLPRLVRNLRQVEALAANWSTYMAAHVNILHNELCTLREKDLRRLEERLAQEIERVEAQAARQQKELVLQGRKLAELAAGFPQRASTVEIRPQVKADSELPLDALYMFFEDQFRGTPEDIKQRVTVYLPVLEEAGVAAGGPPVLDVGCGRGEWLDLLKEQGLPGRGVDLNEVLVEECRGRGLDVVHAEAVEYLRSLESESLAAVTGFHIIEHLKLETLIALLDETVRLLRPGGVAVFETPNPENVQVGSNTFYMDPTHRNPLPSPMMEFMLQSRGFARTRTLRLHPYPQEARLPEDGTELVKRLNAHFYGPQDYAVIGFKP